MITEILSRTVQLLKDAEQSHLIDEWQNLSRYALQKEIRVAILGPFNQGKSTLLNALLGDKHLPVDIVPTTGAAIFIRYGKELETKISLRNGQSFSEKGCDLLRRFAVLDEARDKTGEIESVEVSCPHPILQENVALVDLPGTNERFELADLIEKELFFADAVIQVLNARQLFTLEEEANLRNWVIEAGVQTVFFVVNFFNLLETNDQKAVLKRAETVFKSVSSGLSPKSGIYRVDALPALRAQMQGNIEELKQSGLTNFVDALSNLINEILVHKETYRSYRVKRFAGKVLAALVDHNTSQANLLSQLKREREETDRLQKQKLASFQQALRQIFSSLRKEFGQDNLRKNHKLACFAALRNNTFAKWRESSFKPWIEAKLAFFKVQMNEMSLATRKPFLLPMTLPPAPAVYLPIKPEIVASENNGGGAVGGGVTGALIGTVLFPGVGTIIGAALGGWFGNSVNNSIVEDTEKEKAAALDVYNRQVQNAYETAGEAYLGDFHKKALSILSNKESSWNNLLKFEPISASTLEIQLQEQIEETNDAIANLESNLTQPI